MVPPLVLVLAVLPALPEDWSQARKVMPPATVPFQLALGTKRTEVLALAASRRAVVAAGAPNALQVLPPLVVYCQAPLVLSTATTAMPEAAALSMSVSTPETRAETRVPLLEAEARSSLMAFRLLAPASTGASLTAVTLKVRVLGEASRSMPPLAMPPSSCTWKVKLA